jgi:fibrillarin-like rRNA methylase
MLAILIKNVEYYITWEQQIVITVKTNILNQTKDARSAIVRHTRKDLFGMSDADEYTIIYL